MKKIPQKKGPNDDYRKIVRRNWVICVVALMLILFFYFGLPAIMEFYGSNKS